jgi:hypothetical protein
VQASLLLELLVSVLPQIIGCQKAGSGLTELYVFLRCCGNSRPILVPSRSQENFVAEPEILLISLRICVVPDL